MTTTLPRPLSPEPGREWMTRAACQGHPDPAAFHPAPGEHANEAKQLCRRCPVKTACLAYALNHEKGSGFGHRHGVWGGTTPKQRDRIYRCLNHLCAHGSRTQCSNATNGVVV